MFLFSMLLLIPPPPPVLWIITVCVISTRMSISIDSVMRAFFASHHILGEQLNFCTNIVSMATSAPNIVSRSYSVIKMKPRSVGIFLGFSAWLILIIWNKNVKLIRKPEPILNMSNHFKVLNNERWIICFENFLLTPPPPAGVIGCGGAVEVTGLDFVCFVVINPRVLLANRVDFGLFLFHKFSNFDPPPQFLLTMPLHTLPNMLWNDSSVFDVFPDTTFLTVWGVGVVDLWWGL